MPPLGKFQNMAKGEAYGQRGAKTIHGPRKVGNSPCGVMEREVGVSSAPAGLGVK